jgi:casein kinase II subunit beta
VFVCIFGYDSTVLKYIKQQSNSFLDQLNKDCNMADWVQWFCSMQGHDFFCEVDRDYIESRFNLYGLNQEVPTFSRCLSIILDYVSSDSESDEVYRDAWTRKDCMDLFGRIHARFLLTSRGQEKMHHKYLRGDFGYCPRFYCQKQPVLPIGLSENVGEERVRTFCPRCQQIFVPPVPLAARHVDGAYFGKTFPHLLLLVYRELIEKPNIKEYVPTVYGYKLNKSCAAFKYKKLLTNDMIESASAEVQENETSNSNNKISKSRSSGYHKKMRK